MKMAIEYLESALWFERMAADTHDPMFKASLLKQAADYRKLARERAARLNVPLPKQENDDG